MTDFKLSKKAMFSIPMDVRLQLDILNREVADFESELKAKQDILDSVIELHIYKADAIVNSYLEFTYGAGVLVGETPYFKGPVPAKDNITSIELTGVVIASTAITEQWLILFDTDDAFTLYGSFSGGQSSGTIAGDFTSTNSDVEIKTADWLKKNSNDVVKAGDQFIFGSYIVHPTVNALSAMLAAASLIDSISSNAEDEVTGWGQKLYKQAMTHLKNLADRNNPASLSGVLETDWMEAVAWNIDRNGKDVTKYFDITDDLNPMDI